MSAIEGGAISADGIRLSCEVAGTGAPALVFVHGWSCDRTYWKDQVAHFADRTQVVAVDLAGHGKSGHGKSGHGKSGHRRAKWTMPAFGEDVVAVADQLRLESLVLVGHSMGGDVPRAGRLSFARTPKESRSRTMPFPDAPGPRPGGVLMWPASFP